MPMVIGVRFVQAGKLFYFSPGTLAPMVGDSVVVETPRGVEIAQVAESARQVDDMLIKPPLRNVLRMVTPADLEQQAQRKEREREALAICHEKVEEHGLDMKLVRVEYSLDLSKLMVYFTSNGRVDFRKLVKDLASIFRTRIELKQIGVRDEARMIGGLGPCGRGLCCSQHLKDFQPVSIRMAKDQSLSLNPTKISGVCGRLMCCLAYEHEQYQKTRKQMPKMGKEVITPDGRGVVVDLNPLMETIRARVQHGDGSEVREYNMQDIKRVQPPVSVGEPRAARSKKEPVNDALSAVVPDDEEFIGTEVEMLSDSNRIADD
ncbi:MAG: stage 0 sporulation family protein [Eubacteriales bacterium]|nr:stage 0 sporulation family protein [Eubacteriales bacterium]